MEHFFLALQPTIENAVRHAMEKIRREIGKEHIYSAALVTDSDCITLFLAVNTEEYLAKRDKKDRTPKRLAELRKYWPKEFVDQVADGSFSLNRYIPDEWGYSDGTDSELNQVSQRNCSWRRQPVFSRGCGQRGSLARRLSALSPCPTMIGRRKSRTSPSGGSTLRNSMSSFRFG